MRIACPLCGERDLREFTYRGAAVLLDRPEAGDAAGFDAYLHLRDNPAGPNAELWHHAFGCRAWLRVVRDTRTHAILEVGLARAARAASAAGVAVGAEAGAAAVAGDHAAGGAAAVADAAADADAVAAAAAAAAVADAGADAAAVADAAADPAADAAAVAGAPEAERGTGGGGA